MCLGKRVNLSLGREMITFIAPDFDARRSRAGERRPVGVEVIGFNTDVAHIAATLRLATKNWDCWGIGVAWRWA